jgi:hypothetical protein
MNTITRKMRWILTGMVAVATFSLAQAATYYVATGGNDGNGGSNPTTDALATLERAIALAGDTDTVLMSDGTYYLQNYTGVPVTNAIRIARADAAATVRIKPKQAVGGFTGTRRLLIVDDTGAVIDGLILAEAYASDNPQYSLDDTVGYALLLKAGTVTNCIVTDCTTILGNHPVKITGGVIAMSQIRNTRVTAGSAWNHAVALHMVGGTMTGCVASNNQARGRGTVYLDGSGVQLLDSRVAGNRLLKYEVSGSALCGAAGVTVFNGARVERCTITGNYAETASQNITYVAGGVYLYSGAAKLLNCTVSDNTTVSGNAGGVHLYSASARVENCLFAGNRSLGGASGGIYMQGASARILNSTLYGNVAETKTAGHGLAMTAGTATNLILYANGIGETALTGGNLLRTGGTVAYSCVTPASDANGAGNVPGNPRFADAADGDFRLRFGSPCRDTGATLAAISTDLLGVSRPQSTGYDMGCYEAVPSTEPECAIFIASGAQGAVPLTTTFTTLAAPATGIADYTWTVTDGVTTNTETVLTDTWSYTFTGAGIYDVALTIRYDDDREAYTIEQDAVRVLPTTVHVALNGGHVWPFASPATAATNFHAAIAAVFATESEPGTVKVQPGTYGAANGLGAGNDHLVLLNRHVRLVGQGTSPGDTVIDGNHTRRVLRIAAAGAAVENLTLARGRNLAAAVAKGYGLEIAAGTVSNCIVTNGWSASAASPEAMVLQSGGAVRDTDIRGNRTASANAWTRTGSTVLITGGTMSDCRIFDNQTRSANGTVYLSGSAAILSNSTIRANSALGVEYPPSVSGGVALDGGAQLVGCEVTDNQIGACVLNYSAQTAAGGLNLASGNATVRNCIIRLNRTSNGNAGGVLMGPNTVLINALIVDNSTGTSGGVGGGVQVRDASACVLNCTVAANTNRTAATGHGVYMTAGAITNSIVYGNGPVATRYTVNNLDFTGGTVAYTLAMPKPAGHNNLGGDPLFKNLNGGDYHLRGISPCRQAGVALTEVADYLDGQLRKPNRPYDLGCYRIEAVGSMIVLR